MSWNDFSNAEQQEDRGAIIPHRTPVKVVLKIRPGSHDDESQGWTGGYATRNERSGSVYLDCEYTIIGGKYNKRKVWSLIGLYTPKGDKWGNMGRSFVRAMLESARGINPDDASEAAMAARRISGFGDLNGLEFAALVEVEKAEPGSGYDDKNKIQTVIPVTHKDYASLMAGTAPASQSSPPPSTTQASGTPAWAT